MSGGRRERQYTRLQTRLWLAAIVTQGDYRFNGALDLGWQVKGLGDRAVAQWAIILAGTTLYILAHDLVGRVKTRVWSITIENGVEKFFEKAATSAPFSASVDALRAVSGGEWDVVYHES